MILDPDDPDPVVRECLAHHWIVLNGLVQADAIACKVGQQGWVVRLVNGARVTDHGHVCLAAKPASPASTGGSPRT